MKGTIRNYIRLARYGQRFKLQISLALIFFLGGLALEIYSIIDFASVALVDPEDGFFIIISLILGSVFMICAAMMPPQVLMSLDISLLAQTSVYKKRLQTVVPAVLMGISSLVVLTITRIALSVLNRFVPGTMSNLSICMLILGVIAAFLTVILPLMYKFYLISFVIIIVVFYAGTMGSLFAFDSSSFLTEYTLSLPSPAFCTVLAYLLVIAASVLHLLIAKALYKRPLSKRAFGAAMMKQISSQ